MPSHQSVQESFPFAQNSYTPHYKAMERELQESAFGGNLCAEPILSQGAYFSIMECKRKT